LPHQVLHCKQLRAKRLVIDNLFGGEYGGYLCLMVDPRLTGEQGHPNVGIRGGKRRVAIAEEERAKVITLVVVNEHVQDSVRLCIEVEDSLAIGMVGASGAAL